MSRFGRPWSAGLQGLNANVASSHGERPPASPFSFLFPHSHSSGQHRFIVDSRFRGCYRIVLLLHFVFLLIRLSRPALKHVAPNPRYPTLLLQRVTPCFDFRSFIRQFHATLLVLWKDPLFSPNLRVICFPSQDGTIRLVLCHRRH